MLLNEVFSWNETLYRVVWSEMNKLYLYALKSNDFAVKAFSLDVVQNAERQGQIHRCIDPYVELREQTVSGKALQKLETNYQLIEPIVQNPSILYDRHLRSYLVKRAKEVGVPLNRLMRLVRTWWERGMSKTALNPQYGHAKGKRRSTTVKAGPKVNTEVLPVNEGTRQAFDRACRKYLLTPDHLSIPKAYEHFLSDYKSRHPELKDEQLPTRGQFEYFYRTQFNSGQRSRMRNTLAEYNKNVRPLTGTVYDTVQAAGQVYEIDATVADIHLVSSQDRTKVIGRPTLYVVADVYTGLIVGVHVSLDDPSYKCAADALYSAVSPKEDLCRRLGVELKPQEWQVSGLPSLVKFDKAELSGSRIELFASAYNVMLQTTAPYRADQKGTVESAIGCIQHRLKGEVPGIPDKITLKKAGGKDSRLDAALTLEEYYREAVEAALCANRRVRRITPPGLPADKAPVPERLWQEAIATGQCRLRAINDPLKLRLALLPQYEASVSRDGISVHGIRWTCSQARDQGLLDRIISGNRPKKMTIVLDPADISQAWLVADPQREPFGHWHCVLAPVSSHLAGLTLQRALDYLKVSSAARCKAEKERALYEAGRLTKMTEVVRKAKEEKAQAQKAAGSKTSSQIAVETAENRHQEHIEQEIKNPRVANRPEPELKEPEDDSLPYSGSISEICD